MLTSFLSAVKSNSKELLSHVKCWECLKSRLRSSFTNWPLIPYGRPNSIIHSLPLPPPKFQNIDVQIFQSTLKNKDSFPFGFNHIIAPASILGTSREQPWSSLHLRNFSSKFRHDQISKGQKHKTGREVRRENSGEQIMQLLGGKEKSEVFLCY